MIAVLFLALLVIVSAGVWKQASLHHADGAVQLPPRDPADVIGFGAFCVLPAAVVLLLIVCVVTFH